MGNRLTPLVFLLLFSLLVSTGQRASSPQASSIAESAAEVDEASPTRETSAPTFSEVHFRNCAAAWAAGAAPIHIGEPGYESRMDGDHDGIACEPLRRY